MTLPSEEHRALLLAALSAYQYSGDLASREQARKVFELADELETLIRTAEIEKD